MKNWDEEDPMTDEDGVDDVPYDDDEHIDWDSEDVGTPD
jgi:hypothetical protein